MFSNHYHFNSNQEQILMTRYDYVLLPLLENDQNANIRTSHGNALVPRFSLKGDDIFKDFPTNEAIKFDKKKFIKAIQYGMILLILYRDEYDKWKGGRERTIYPMVLGKSTKGDLLIRGYHLKGWSVSEGRVAEKVWRMFRADRVKSMTFTGSFFRLPPAGYKMDDKGMKGGIIQAADFTQIRANQQKLVNSMKVQPVSEAVMGKQGGVPNVYLENTQSKLDLTKPWDNRFISKKQAPNIRCAVLKPVFGGDDVIALGVLGTKGHTAKLYEGNHLMGAYKVVDSFMCDKIEEKKNIDGKTTFDVYAFKQMK